ncbi:Transposase family Tnp2 protein [Ceratobasidium sp. AG-Ba]|nr:Transposase family Tnp2 protein [Ceratobasidium sp. AG-Ba]
MARPGVVLQSLDGYRRPPQPSTAPQALPRPKRRCFCCGRDLGTRQLTRHLTIFLEQLDEELALADQFEGSDEDYDTIGYPMGVDDNGIDVEGDAIDAQNEAGFDQAQFHELPAVDVGPVDIDIPADPDTAPVEYIPPFIGKHNPPVRINNWPDPDPDLDDIDDPGSDGSSIGEEIVDEVDGDPPFEELPIPPIEANIDPLFEPDMADAQVRGVMELELGDLAEEEWLALYDTTLSNKDANIFKFLATRLRTHFSRQTYDELRHGVCEPLWIPSEFVVYRRLRIMAGFETRTYDCCVNSCCFLGKYSDGQVSHFCKEPRYTAGGRARRSFYYSPLIPQLQALFRNLDMLEKLHYRSSVENASEPGVFEDVYDGEHYRRLRGKRLNPDGEYKILDNPEDLALGLSTDGFTLFKRRRRGLSTAWPIIFLNYNIHPRYRVRLENIICVGVIPGPKQCKDLNSFLAPVFDELLLLERGVVIVKVAPGRAGRTLEFVLRAFLIMIFGDIPAVSKLLALKGHNAKVPCRTCYAKGYLCKLPKNLVYYLPLRYPGDEDGYPPELLLMRTHNGFLQHYNVLDDLEDRAAQRKKYAQEHGINDRPIFAHLKSFDLAQCAPYDIMHLLFENLVPNMIKHWIGKFKKLDQGTGNYRISDAVWNEIGRLTTEATCTIPAAFVGTLPDIAQDRTLYKAEAYSFWVQYIAPILLLNRLPEPYYQHFLLMRDIIILSAQLNITSEQVNELETMVNQWVIDYEKYYYQYEHDRLPACPLTIHALLHIPHYIRKTGPLWASWAFGMERFCGHLLPAVRNSYQPYRHLDNYIMRSAQMKVVCHTYGLPTLARSTVKWTFEGRERMSTREVTHPMFPNVILGIPIKRNVQLDTLLTNQFTRFLSLIYPQYETGAQLRERLDTQSIVSYGRFRMTDDGDRIRTASAVETTKRSTGNVRDNSFVRFTVLPDLNATNNGDDTPYEQVNYGQLIGIYYFEFITDLFTNARVPYLVGSIALCEGTNFLDAALPENPQVTYRKLTNPSIFHLSTIDAVVWRIKISRRDWAIIDCSRNGARTQFVNDDE